MAKNDDPLPEERRVTLFGVAGTGKMRSLHDYILLLEVYAR